MAIPGEDLHLRHWVKKDVTYFALNKIAAVLLFTAVTTYSLTVYRVSREECAILRENVP